MKIDFSKIIFGNDEMQKAAHVNYTSGFSGKKDIYY
jgi:hypothetical protein